MEKLHITESAKGATLAVRVITRASRNEITSVSGGVLKVRLTAPPVEGAANAVLIEFLAARFGVKRSQVTLVAGHATRQKLVRITGLSAREIERRLLEEGT